MTGGHGDVLLFRVFTLFRHVVWGSQGKKDTNVPCYGMVPNAIKPSGEQRKWDLRGHWTADATESQNGVP